MMQIKSYLANVGEEARDPTDLSMLRIIYVSPENVKHFCLFIM